MTDNIIKGEKEAAEITSGDKPAARIRINGHTYVPEDSALRARGMEWGMGYEHGLKQGRLQGLEKAAAAARDHTPNRPLQSRSTGMAIERAIEALKEQAND